MNAKIGDVDISVPCRPRYIPLIKQVVADVAVEAGLSREEASDITIAVLEAVANAIKHSKGTTVRLLMATKGDLVVARVTDDGIGFVYNGSHWKFPKETAKSGRGIPLMKSLSDRFSIKTRIGYGTIVMLAKRCAH